MAREFSRTRRIGEQMQRELADLLRTEVKDPRVERVTVSEVNVAGDLSSARIYVTRLGGDPEAVAEAVTALRGAAGFLRRELARRIRLRTIPELRFLEDTSFDRGAHLSKLIDDAVAEDRAHASDSTPEGGDDDGTPSS